MPNNEVRIIGGQWKGRKLRFESRPALRPTLGRVRETLFNWLGPFIEGARCLDLYAGSGALGFEALSRGAAEVTFVERDRKAARSVRANIDLLGARATVVCDSALRFLDRSRQHYDIIFCDPPFDDRLPSDLVATLIEGHLAPHGFLYLESSRRSHLPETRLPKVGHRIRHAAAGDCQFALYRGPDPAVS